MTWQKLCRPDDIPDERGREFLIGNRVLAVFRSADRYYAVEGMCAHQGGPLAQGQFDEPCVTCPWHGWQYDVTTGNNLLTRKKMLDTFPLEFRDGDLWINMDTDPSSLSSSP